MGASSTWTQDKPAVWWILSAAVAASGIAALLLAVRSFQGDALSGVPFVLTVIACIASAMGLSRVAKGAI